MCFNDCCRHKLLVQVAKVTGCGKVFTAESADDLAIKLFTNVSLGRGAQLPFDVVSFPIFQRD